MDGRLVSRLVELGSAESVPKEEEEGGSRVVLRFKPFHALAAFLALVAYI